jgi:cell pole-organizing protein PopZ
MSSDDVANQPDLAEILASIRRLTTQEQGQQAADNFELPAVFRPAKPSVVAETKPPRLANKLSELLRRTTPLPPPAPTEAFIPAMPTGEAKQADWASWLGAQHVAGQTVAAAPQIEAVPPPFRASPRFRVLLAEHALKHLSDEDVRNIVGELLMVAVSRTGAVADVTLTSDRLDEPEVAPAVAPAPDRSVIENMVAELLRPMLRTWLVENMTTTVERALASELGRMFGPVSRPHTSHPVVPMPGGRRSPPRHDPFLDPR